MDELIHYWRGVPFCSITALTAEQRAQVVAAMSDANTWGRGRFADPDYVRQRFDVERRLHRAFQCRGGSPERAHPIYAHLGHQPAWRAHNRFTALPLANLADQVTFTRGDSLVTWHPELHGPLAGPDSDHLFVASDLPVLRATLADGEYLEAQIWCDPASRILEPEG